MYNQKQEIPTEEDEYIRQNILLSTDCVMRIDALKASGGFSSRGRTIQEVINIFWDIRSTCQMYARGCLEATKLDDSETYVLRLGATLAIILRYMLRFTESNEPNALKAENDYLIKQLALKNIEIERLKASK